ncbi:DUF4097 family beta strand repeat-containing protein [Bacteroidota bacterium]
MKRINKITSVLLILIFISFSVSGQQEISFGLKDSGKIRKVIITNLMGSLKVKSYDGDEVKVRYDKKQIEKKLKKYPDKAKGLKPLTHDYSDDTGLGFSVHDEDGEIQIIGSPFELFSGLFNGSEDELEVPDYEFLIPDDVERIVINGGQFIFHPDNDKTRLFISNLETEIVVNSFGGGIFIEDISGPATIHSVSGTTEVIFSTIIQENPISITSSSGDIDITIPKNTPADLNFNAIMGEVYTDFDIKTGVKRKAPKYDIPLISIENIGYHGKINGGGVDINLTAITGDIYLRKK